MHTLARVCPGDINYIHMVLFLYKPVEQVMYLKLRKAIIFWVWLRNKEDCRKQSNKIKVTRVEMISIQIAHMW